MTKSEYGLGLLMLLALSMSDTFAALIAADEPTLGADTVTLDTQSALEWLDTDLTLNLSWNDAESIYSQLGFRHASQIEVTEFFTHAGITGIGGGTSAANYAPSKSLQELITCLAGYYPPTGQDTCSTTGWTEIDATGRAEKSWIVRDNAAAVATVIVDSNNVMGPDPVIFDTFAHPAVGHWMVRPAPVRPGVTAVSTEITALAGVELRYGEYVSEEFDLDTVFGAIDSASLEITMTGHVGKLEICISECVLRDFLNVLFGFRREIDGLGGVYDTIDSPAESSTIYIIDVADMLTGRKTLDFLLDGKGAILFEHNILIGPASGTIRVIDAPSYTLERVVLNVEGPLPFIPVSINLDLKHNPSQVKIKEGQNHDNTKIKVAILSDSEFDAMQVDSSTVELGPSGALPTIGELKDVDTDGDIDLELQFKAPGISCGDTEVSLTGQTYAGALFAGTDRIETVGKECD